MQTVKIISDNNGWVVDVNCPSFDSTKCTLYYSAHNEMKFISENQTSTRVELHVVDSSPEPLEDLCYKCARCKISMAQNQK